MWSNRRVKIGLAASVLLFGLPVVACGGPEPVAGVSSGSPVVTSLPLSTTMPAPASSVASDDALSSGHSQKQGHGTNAPQAKKPPATDTCASVRQKWTTGSQSLAATVSSSEDPRLSKLSDVQIVNNFNGCWDRITFVVSGNSAPAARVEYAPKVFNDARGDEVHVNGDAILHVIIYTHGGTPLSFQPVNGKAIRAIADAGAFEGQVTFAVGANKDANGKLLPFQVISTSSTGDIILDVSHPAP